MKGGSFISSLSAASVKWLSWSRWRCGRPRRPRFVEPHPRVVGATNTNQTPLIRPALLPLSPQHNKTVLLNEAKVALNATKADIRRAVAPLLVPKIGDKYKEIIAVRNAGEGAV